MLKSREMSRKATVDFKNFLPVRVPLDALVSSDRHWSEADFTSCRSWHRVSDHSHELSLESFASVKVQCPASHCKLFATEITKALTFAQNGMK